jgi:hypothetical protein
MSGFFYRVTAQGDGITSHKHFSVSSISANEFVRAYNQDDFNWSVECVLISKDELVSGQTVFFMNGFKHANVQRSSNTLPVVVQGDSVEELKKDILEKIESIQWHPVYDVADYDEYPKDRWSNLDKKLNKTLPGFMEDLCRSDSMHFKMNAGMTSDIEEDADWIKVKVTLNKGTVE